VFLYQVLLADPSKRFRTQWVGDVVSASGRSRQYKMHDHTNGGEYSLHGSRTEASAL
jgi:hypothetical protein